MVERLCVPLIHSTVERHLNLAASGVCASAACAPNSASTLTPLSTGLSACVVAMASSLESVQRGEEFIEEDGGGPFPSTKSPGSAEASRTGGTARSSGSGSSRPSAPPT